MISIFKTSAHSYGEYDAQDFLLDGQLTVGDIVARLADAGNVHADWVFRTMAPRWIFPEAEVASLRHAA